jgi:hypothetical protein
MDASRNHAHIETAASNFPDFVSIVMPIQRLGSVIFLLPLAAERRLN